MKRRALAFAVSAAFLSTAAVAGNAGNAPRTDTHPHVKSAQPQHGASMQKLRQSAQHLRESIQAIAGKPAGPERDKAIRNAQEALFDTQRAMVSLPPELRSGGTKMISEGGKSAAQQPQDARGHEASLAQLNRAADKLWASIDAMQQQHEGERRDEAIQHAHQAVWDTYEAMLAMPAEGRGQKTAMASGAKANGARDGGEAKSSKDAKAKADAYGVLLVPMSVAGNERLGNGCWARVYENPEFGGTSLTVVGPVNVPDLAATTAHDWNGADSVIVGPKARVVLFDGENFNDRSATIEGARSIAHLRDEKIGLLEKVDSMKVTCTG